MSIFGMSLAVAILIVGLFFIDAIEGLLRMQFAVMQRQDVTATFAEPASAAPCTSSSDCPASCRSKPRATCRWLSASNIDRDDLRLPVCRRRRSSTASSTGRSSP